MGCRLSKQHYSRFTATKVRCEENSSQIFFSCKNQQQKKKMITYYRSIAYIKKKGSQLKKSKNCGDIRLCYCPYLLLKRSRTHYILSSCEEDTSPRGQQQKKRRFQEKSDLTYKKSVMCFTFVKGTRSRRLKRFPFQNNDVLAHCPSQKRIYSRDGASNECQLKNVIFNVHQSPNPNHFGIATKMPHVFWKNCSSYILRKHENPTSYLFHQFKSGLREVTQFMVLNLLDPQAQSLFIYSKPCEAVQKAFEDKEVEVGGSLALQYSIGSYGLGYACKKGLKSRSPNQDDFFILKVNDWSLCGVFDGHGLHGHKISHFIHLVLPYIILSDYLFESEPFFVLQQAFLKAHSLLNALSSGFFIDIDCTFSGTTGTLVLLREDQCFVANVGDSRAVLCKHEKNVCNALELTRDHKPVHEHEYQRIQLSGGEVRRLQGDIAYRVFVKNKMYPGLAMSRAIGDTTGSIVGVIPVPDMTFLPIHYEDKFILMSTDGVWEFISSEAAICLVYANGEQGAQRAADLLAIESWRCWVQEEESLVDDITCIVVWLRA